jgi:hypothetical protein
LKLKSNRSVFDDDCLVEPDLLEFEVLFPAHELSSQYLTVDLSCRRCDGGQACLSE